MARDWKSIALLSLGFVAGVGYTVACRGKKPTDAHADPIEFSSTPRAARTVVEVLHFPTATMPKSSLPPGEFEIGELGQPHKENACSPIGKFRTVSGDTNKVYEFDLDGLEAACCPSGFSFIGWNSDNEAICLEDI